MILNIINKKLTIELSEEETAEAKNLLSSWLNPNSPVNSPIIPSPSNPPIISPPVVPPPISPPTGDFFNVTNPESGKLHLSWNGFFNAKIHITIAED